MRYGLSGEAGFNDGAAFPFVVFSLLWLEHGTVDDWAGGWALHRLLSTLLFLVNSPTRMSQRWLMGWFGIRGIGSLYYLAYSLNHGLNSDPAPLVGITLSVVALSVTLHGITSPLLELHKKSSLPGEAPQDPAHTAARARASPEM